MIRRDHCVRLDSLLDRRGLEAVWLAQPNTFSWLTGGNNVVDHESGIGVAAAGYDGDSVTILTDSIEGDRLSAEQLPEGVAIETFPWYEGTLAEAVADRSPRPAAADFDVSGLGPVDVTALRRPLTDADIERYRDLAGDAAAAVERACRDCRETTTERALAASLRGDLAGRGVETPVLLVGGAERAVRYRHFPPTDGALGDYALVSVTAARDGLHASCTRTVAFDPPDWLEARHNAAMTVEVAALAATREAVRRESTKNEDHGENGTDTNARTSTAGDVFAAIIAAYEAAGYPGEWEQHHQGGAAGYAGREWIAVPGSDEPVIAPMAYAWNPTVRGAKSEDTALVSEAGVEVLTETGNWPTREVRAPDREGSLSRHEILHR